MDNTEFDDSKKGLSIASMVLGIIGLLFLCVPPFGVICGLLALIFGAISLNKKQGIQGMATAGIVLGIITLVLWVVVFVFLIGILGMASTMAGFA